MVKMRLALALIIAAVGWAIVIVVSGGNVVGAVLVSLPNTLVGWLAGRAIAWAA